MVIVEESIERERKIERGKKGSENFPFDCVIYKIVHIEKKRE